MKKKKQNKVVNILFILFLIIFIPIILFLGIILLKSLFKPNEIPGLFGYKPMIVMSGSMEHEIEIGDIAIVKEINEKDLKVNDIIAYRIDETVITHRIIEIKEEDKEKVFITKGDNNNEKDNVLVKENNIEGKYLFKVPYVGNALIWLQKPSGLLICVLVIVLGSGTYFFAEGQKELKKIKNKN